MVLVLCVSQAHAQKADFKRIERYMPLGDPNLNANWDWTVSGPGHTVYYQSDFNGIQSRTIQTPFYTNGHPLNTVVEKDMYPQDGWVLAFRDFGTSTSAPELPFFALYNKYRGILRVMFYNARSLSYNKFEVSLRFKSTSYTGGFLTFTDDTKTTLADYDKAKKEIYATTANSLNGWIFADFVLFGFDPNMSASTQMRIDISGFNVSNLQLSSTEFTLTEILTDANPTGGKTGTDFAGAIKKGAKTYKDVNSASKDLREAVTKQEKANKNPWWKNTLKSVVGNTASPTLISSVAPFAGSLIGFISFLVSGKDDPTPRQPMQFEGSISFDGSITTDNFPLYTIDLGMKSGTGANPSSYYRVLRDIKWGVFSLNNKPVVDDILYIGDYCYWNSHYNECECEDYPYVDHSFFKSISYNFNTNAGVTLQSIKLAYAPGNAPPSTFRTISEMQSFRWSGNSGKIAVELKYRTNSPTMFYDDEFVVYKVFPTSRNSIMTTINGYMNFGDECGNRKINAPSIAMEQDIEGLTSESPAVFPNPAESFVNIAYILPEDTYVNLYITDLSGKIVNRFKDRNNEKAGTYRYVWDLDDENGARVAPGYYIYVLQHQNGYHSGKILVK
jgi:hypothetical protein